MICKFCGNEIDDGSDFCYICGQKVEAPAFAGAAAAGEAQPAAEAASGFEKTVAIETPDEAPAAPAAPAAAEGKKGKDPNAASRAARFFSFLFALIGLILYRKQLKKGNEAKAVSILNALMRGLCVKMAIVVLVLGKKYLV